jgi:hypothetical protein
MYKLISVARTLAAVDCPGHRRRAISSAYYALFQELQLACANQLVGAPNSTLWDAENWDCVFRSLSHASAKTVCLAIRTSFVDSDVEIASVKNNITKHNGDLNKVNAQIEAKSSTPKDSRTDEQKLELKQLKNSAASHKLKIRKANAKCTALKKQRRSEAIHTFATAFANLQAERHRADYEFGYDPEKKEVEASIQAAEAALKAFNKAPAPDRVYMIVSMMFKKRDIP